MTIKDVIDIIQKEGLTNYNLNEARYNREDEVSIKKENDNWSVYVTDERASKIAGSEFIFISEEDACNNFVKRLRISNKIKNRKV